MKLREAIIELVNNRGLSKYRIAKEIGVGPIMIDKYLNGTRMRPDLAMRFEDTFGIEIDKEDWYMSRVEE